MGARNVESSEWEWEEGGLPWGTRDTYSDIKYTVLCRECGKRYERTLSPYRLKQFLKGEIDNMQAFGDIVDDESAFLMLFKVCVECNGGWEIERVEVKPRR